MKKLITLVLLAATFATAASAQQTDYALATAQDWIDFANGINNGTIPATTDAHMTADIDLGDIVSTIGTNARAYSGTFDGQGHTLTVNYVSSEEWCSPFTVIGGARIRNLNTSGRIELRNHYHAAGIAGKLTNNSANVIERCRSSITIVMNAYGLHGGFVGNMYSGSKLTLKDCIFDGEMTGTGGSVSSALVGRVNSGVTLNVSNCLITGTFSQTVNLVYDAGIVAGITATNTYYTSDNIANAQGATAANAEQLADGTIATALQANRTEKVWQQDADSNMPEFNLFIIQTPLTLDANGYYLLATPQDWKDFAELVRVKPRAMTRMTADIDLGDDQTTIGSYDPDSKVNNRFSGIFDGQGHTLTINYDRTDYAYTQAFEDNAAAPFLYITDATIRNLHVEGTIATASKFVGGIVGDISGTQNLIEGCRSSVSITSSVNSDGCIGGLISHMTNNQTVTVRDCVFDGIINAPSAWGNGGFMGYKYGTATFENCLFAPTELNLSTNQGNTFVRNGGGTLTISNCYYTRQHGTAQGILTTADELANGRTAFYLQNGRDDMFWGQAIGTDPMPLLTTDVTRRVYRSAEGFTNDASAAIADQDILPLLYTRDADGNITITGYDDHLAPATDFALVIPDAIDGAPVTAIVNSAFRYKSAITSVTIGRNVTTIGTYAFADCANLTSATMAEDINIETVSDHLFYNCPKLNIFTVPKSVKTIGGYAFEACRALTNITLPTDGQLTTIQDGAFQNCSALPTIVLPATLTTVNAVAFRNCTALDNVTIPSSVTAIGNTCFFGCTALKSIVIPNSVTSMGTQMFYNCTALATASFEDGCQLTAIPGETFRNTALTAFTIPASVTTISDASFYQTPLAAISIPANVTTIGNFAFRYCEKLNNVVLPGTLQYIGDWSFAYCTALENLTFEEGLTSINGGVFQYSGLKNVVLPSTLGTIGVNLFYQCNQLETLDLSRCVNVYELYANTTLRGWNTITYGVPATTKIILPPYATATLGANDEVKDIGFDLTQDEEGYYNIGTREDFYKFAAFTRHADNAAANARLTADIDLTGEEIKIGVQTNNNNYLAYKGIFDGQGHTLTVNYTSGTAKGVAVFSAVEGATIRRLRVAGNIEAYALHCAGFVVSALKSLTMEDCESAVTLNGHAATATNMHMGGFIGHGATAQITMTDCHFCGKLLGGNTVRYGAAFLAWMESAGRISYTSCLNTGTFDVAPAYCAPLGHTQYNNQSTATLCFYKSTDKVAKDNLIQPLTAEQLATGQIAYKLQGGRDEQHWGQLIGTDAAPRLTTAAGTRVYRGQNYTNEIVEYTGLQKDDEGYYLIGGTGDWETFAKLVEDEPMVNARLTTDVTVIDDTMVGTEAAPYAGIFDGQGHTLTVGYNVSDTRCAPFHYITGATIRHLHVAGSLTTSGQVGGGIAGFAQGTCLIENCHSSVAINGTKVSSTADTYGGIVGVNYRGTLTISDCVFDGSITCTDRNHCGGFVGYTDNGTTTATNCLLAATFNLNDNGTNVTFLRYNGTIANSYYVNPLNVRQGLQATAGQLGSGEVAWRLQAERDDMFWGQLIGTDPMPVLTNDEGRRVFLHHDGTFANTPDEIQLQQDEDGTYLIASAGELQWFATKVNFGETAASARLTADIDLDGSETNQWQPIGTTAAKYTGTFDGQHHTVSGLYWHGQKQPNIGFFGYVGAATIKGLRVEGDITCDDPDHGGTDTGSSKFVGGIVGHTDGVATISRCSFAGNVKGTLEVGGIVGGGQCQITDCYNEATVTFYSVSNFAAGGILGYQGSGTVQITNCYNRGQIINEGNATAYMDGISPAGTLSNCYSLAGCCFNGSGADGTAGMSRATQVTAEQLASGEVTYRLQANRGDIAWGQRLGSDPAPILTASLDYAVCKRISDDTYFNVEFSDELARDDDGYYLIHNGAELKTFADMVNEGNIYLNARLTDDIELTGTWPGIGTGGTPFAGTFDGQRHTVSGVSGGSGLFWAVAAGGTVTSVIVDGSIYSGNEAGGIVNYNNGTITRCGFIGSMGGGGGTNNGHVAGIAASNGRSGSITHCFNRGSVSARYVGGIVGVNYGTVKYCYNAGSLRMDLIKTSSAIIGDRWEGAVSDCYTLEGSATHHGSEGYAGQTMTAEQFASGEVCYLLQKDFKLEQIWGQKIGEDDAPVLTDARSCLVALNTDDATYYNPYIEPTPYAIYCSNGTLYFDRLDISVNVGDIYDGHTVTYVWSGDDVVHTQLTGKGYSPWGDIVNMNNKCIYEIVFTEAFSQVRPTNLERWFANTNVHGITGLSNLNTSEVTSMAKLFYGCYQIEALDLSSFNTAKVTDMNGMFWGCNNLTSLDISSFNTAKVTNMSYMFYNCFELPSLDVSNFNTANVTDMRYMFSNCFTLPSLDVSNLNTSNVTHMGCMFYKCGHLTTIDLSSFNTAKVTNMSDMFLDCGNLMTVDLSSFNTANVTYMGSMFNRCTSLTTLDLSNFDITNVQDLSDMFYRCKSLTTIDLSSFNPANNIFVDEMFSECDNLKTIYCNNRWKVTKYLGLNAFASSPELVGAVSYDPEKISIEFANPVTGYFTHKNPLRGDANGDGRLTVADVVAITAHLNGIEPEYFDALQADTDADGEITEEDVHRLAEIMVGKVEK